MKSEPASSKSDGTRRHQDDLMVAGLESRDGVHNRLNPLQGEFTLRVYNCGGSQFNDHAFCATQEVVSLAFVLM
jgi:hypothetical protein